MVIKYIDNELEKIEKNLRKAEETNLKDVLVFQELEYQRGVLCTICAYMLSAESMAAKGKWETHAKLMAKFIAALPDERQYKLSNPEKEASRTAGIEELKNVYEKHVKIFVSGDYSYISPEAYSADIKAMTAVVCSVFQAYRKIYLG